MKKVAILQSNYIPWKGYFDLIAAVDEFIIYDDMQYTRRDWRNRNLIKTAQGLKWLSVPVKVKGKYLQSIRETEIDGNNWQKNHWGNLQQNYRKAPHYREISQLLAALYLEQTHSHLTPLNLSFIRKICDYLSIETKISHSWDYTLVEGKTERLAALCQQAGADEYISGPAAIDYIDEQCFSEKGITLSWFDYSGYQQYPQLWEGFEHGVTILDLLFNCGKDSVNYMRHLKK